MRIETDWHRWRWVGGCLLRSFMVASGGQPFAPEHVWCGTESAPRISPPRTPWRLLDCRLTRCPGSLTACSRGPGRGSWRMRTRSQARCVPTAPGWTAAEAAEGQHAAGQGSSLRSFPPKGALNCWCMRATRRLPRPQTPLPARPSPRTHARAPRRPRRPGTPTTGACCAPRLWARQMRARMACCCAR